MSKIYKELSYLLLDQKILNREKEDLEKRIMIKLKSLGVKGTSYSEVVIKMSGTNDKYATAFGAAEKLIDRRDIIVTELTVIENTIKYISDTMKNSKLLEYEVFSLHYLEGLSLSEIARQKHYSLDRIKQISSNISKKFSCQ